MSGPEMLAAISMQQSLNSNLIRSELRNAVHETRLHHDNSVKWAAKVLSSVTLQSSRHISSW